VALYLHNGNEYLEGMLGAYKARCAPTNVNYRYRAEELRYVLADSGARAVIHHLAFAPTLAEVIDDLPDLDLIIHVEDGSGAAPLAGSVEYEAALSAPAAELPGELVEGWSGDDLYVCYTGGTTGMPKGVLWRQADFLVAALGIRRRDGDDVEELAELAATARGSNLRALPAPPLMHGAAHWNAMSCWSAGGTVIIQDHPERLDPVDIWSVVERERATSLLIVGDPFARPLVDELDRAAAAGRPHDTSSLRHLLSGGAVLSPGVRDELLARVPGLTVVDVLGSTESGRQAVSQVRDRDVTGTAFSPESTAVVLTEDRSRRVAAGAGEVGWLAQTGRVPRGYLGDEAKTRATFPVIDGVRHAVAGDRARLRADGSIELLGRDSVTINTGGEKVFAEEVETALKTHPSVHDAVVCGRPSERWGQEVVGVVAFRDGRRATEAELRDHCRSALADFKVPKAVVVVGDVVRSPSGKADYRWAREVTEAASTPRN
jgi:fatty-acyl-CoA synthase